MLAFSIAIAISLFVFIMMTLIVLRQSDSQREMQRRLDQFMDPSAEEEMVDPDDLRKIPFLQRTVGRVLGDLMDTLSYFAPAAIPKLMERRIMLAGKQGVSDTLYVFTKERLNYENITYLPIGERPFEKYTLNLKNGSDKLREFWPTEINGIDPEGTLFEKASGKKLTYDADVEIEKEYYLLKRGYF